ncbi:hypothetical protein EK904_004551, partial [Melospiza melodia maxima]
MVVSDFRDFSRGFNCSLIVTVFNDKHTFVKLQTFNVKLKVKTVSSWSRIRLMSRNFMLRRTKYDALFYTGFQ